MKLKFLAAVLFIYNISDVLSFEQTHFTQSNVDSVNYNSIHKNFTTTSAISCAVACKTSTQTCTHAVITNLGYKNVLCSLVDGDNGTYHLSLVGDASKLWTIGKMVS